MKSREAGKAKSRKAEKQRKQGSRKEKKQVKQRSMKSREAAKAKGGEAEKQRSKEAEKQNSRKAEKQKSIEPGTQKIQNLPRKKKKTSLYIHPKEFNEFHGGPESKSRGSKKQGGGFKEIRAPNSSPGLWVSSLAQCRLHGGSGRKLRFLVLLQPQVPRPHRVRIRFQIRSASQVRSVGSVRSAGDAQVTDKAFSLTLLMLFLQHAQLSL